MSLAALMSSDKTTWQTPDVVLDLVRQLSPIALDPCTVPENPTGARVICVERMPREPGRLTYVDGLDQSWPALARDGGGLIYVNPPFGRGVATWMARCYGAKRWGCEVVALVPARVDTIWWNCWVAPPTAQAVCFWRGRLTFKGAPAPAPFPSAIVYWGPRPHRFADVFSTVGAIWS